MMTVWAIIPQGDAWYDFVVEKSLQRVLPFAVCNVCNAYQSGPSNPIALGPEHKAAALTRGFLKECARKGGLYARTLRGPKLTTYDSARDIGSYGVQPEDFDVLRQRLCAIVASDQEPRILGPSSRLGALRVAYSGSARYDFCVGLEHGMNGVLCRKSIFEEHFGDMKSVAVYNELGSPDHAPIQEYVEIDAPWLKYADPYVDQIKLSACKGCGGWFQNFCGPSPQILDLNPPPLFRVPGVTGIFCSDLFRQLWERSEWSGLEVIRTENLAEKLLRVPDEDLSAEDWETILQLDEED